MDCPGAYSPSLAPLGNRVAAGDRRGLSVARTRRRATDSGGQHIGADYPYPNRGAVPGALWRSLLEAATDRIDVLVYAGLFLPDGYPEIAKLLASKAEQGTKVRLTLGDPDSDAVRRRGEEERIGDGLAARVRLGLLYLRDAIGAPGVELRFHATTLYNSIYRFDDDMLVNTHVYGAPAAHSPVLHLRRLPGGRLFDHYQASFERVWEQASTENVSAVLAQEGGSGGSDRLLQ
jgi:hypothetical protein